MEREPKVGAAVVYTDEHREKHAALVTKWWGASGNPACNLLYVSSDESKTDPYGSQIERRSSTCHQSVNSAGANCWAWPDE